MLFSFIASEEWKWIIATLIVLLCLLLIPVGLFLLSFPSSIEKPRPHEYPGIILYENTSAALDDFPTFHVNEVLIYQSPQQPEAVHIMKIFLAKQSCDHLPSDVVSNNYQSLSPPPNATLYLLKGSELKYNICAATNESHKSAAYMDFYIVSGLHEIKQGKKPHDYVHHSDIYLGYSKSLPNDTKPIHGWRCSIITYTVNRRGYYSTLLSPSNIPVEDVKVWHETNNSYKIIKVHSLPAFCEESDTHIKDETCDITIESSMHAWISQHQCAVVVVKTKVNMMDESNFTEVVVQFSYRDAGRNLFYIFGCVILLVSLLIPTVLVLRSIQKYFTARR